MLFRHSCDVKRNVPVGTNGRHQQTALASGVKCLFIPMPSRYEIENGFSIGSAYDAYFQPTADIKTGDQLVWNGDKYNVRAVRTYADVPSIAHKHVLATREGL